MEGAADQTERSVLLVSRVYGNCVTHAKRINHGYVVADTITHFLVHTLHFFYINAVTHNIPLAATICNLHCYILRDPNTNQN